METIRQISTYPLHLSLMNTLEKQGSSRFVTKSNALINAMVSLSLQGNRFLAFAISLLDRHVEIQVGQDVIVEVPVKEFADTFGIPKTAIYRELEGLADQLQQKVITLPADQTPSGRRIKIGIISAQEYHDQQGRVWLEFDKRLIPHLLGLKQQFTSYQLKHVYQFSSAHTWRIYELLKQHKTIGKRTIEVEELRRMTDTAGKYPRIADFRRYVVEPAIAELNRLSDISVDDPEPIKRGRVITSFLFFIRDNKNTKSLQDKIRDKANLLDNGKSLVPNLEAVLRDEFNVSQKQARQIANLAKGKEAVVMKKLPKLQTRYEALAEKKTSLGGYVFRALKDELTSKQRNLPL